MRNENGRGLASGVGLGRVVVGVMLCGVCWVGGVGRAADERTAMTEHGKEVALNPFGIGSCYTNNRSAGDDERWIPQMEAIGIRVMRTCHTSWDNVEREGGK